MAEHSFQSWADRFDLGDKAEPIFESLKKSWQDASDKHSGVSAEIVHSLAAEFGLSEEHARTVADEAWIILHKSSVAASDQHGGHADHHEVAGYEDPTDPEEKKSEKIFLTLMPLALVAFIAAFALYGAWIWQNQPADKPSVMAMVHDKKESKEEEAAAPAGGGGGGTLAANATLAESSSVVILHEPKGIRLSGLAGSPDVIAIGAMVERAFPGQKIRGRMGQMEGMAASQWVKQLPEVLEAMKGVGSSLTVMGSQVTLKGVDLDKEMWSQKLRGIFGDEAEITIENIEASPAASGEPAAEPETHSEGH